MGCLGSKTVKERLSSLKLRGKHKYNYNKFLSPIRNTVFTKEDFHPLVYQPTNMTPRQITLIRKAWNAFVSGPDSFHNASYAFVRLFVLAPESASLFQFLKDDDLSAMNLLRNTVMYEHITYVVNFMSDVVENMEDEEDIKTKATELGQRHVYHGARIDFIQSLAEGFLFALEKTLWPEVDAEVMRAWESLLLVVVHYWALGFGQEENEPTSCNMENNTSKYKCMPKARSIKDDLTNGEEKADVDPTLLESDEADGERTPESASVS